MYGTGRRAVSAAGALATSASGRDPFDQRYGTDTARHVRLEGLVVRGDHREQGVRYQPSDAGRVRERLSGLPLDPAEAAFVDVGSGKGRVVLVASTMPFKRVVGVEFSEGLDLIARSNVDRFPPTERRARAVELVCMDATEYQFPTDPLVVYFYNPFLRSVMESVMSNLRRSLEQRPRPCVVLLEGDESLSPLIVSAGWARTGAGSFWRS